MNLRFSSYSNSVSFFLLLSCLLFVLPVAQAEFIHHKAPAHEQSKQAEQQYKQHKKKRAKGNKRVKRQQSPILIGFWTFLLIVGFLLAIIAPFVFLASASVTWGLMGLIAGAVSFIAGLLLYSSIMNDATGMGGLITVLVGIALFIGLSFVLGVIFLLVGLLANSLAYILAGGGLLALLLILILGFSLA